MLDKIRLHAKGELPSDYHANLGKGFDEKCVKFLRVDYDEVVERVKQGGTDKEMLDWCFIVGRKPEDDPTHLQMFAPADVRALLAGFDDPQLHFIAGRLVPLHARLFANDIVFSGRKPR